MGWVVLQMDGLCCVMNGRRWAVFYSTMYSMYEAREGIAYTDDGVSG